MNKLRTSAWGLITFPGKLTAAVTSCILHYQEQQNIEELNNKTIQSHHICIIYRFYLVTATEGVYYSPAELDSYPPFIFPFRYTTIERLCILHIVYTSI